MAFSGPAPELINSRLAMLAFVAALGAELATGESVFQQLKDQPVLVVAGAVLFAWASLVPILLGRAGDYEKGVGPFTRAAEITNGRAAMIGFAALLIIEKFSHSALF